MTTRFKFVKEFGPIAKIGGFHVPSFMLDAGEPVMFDPGVSAFGPMYLKELTARFGTRVRESLLMLLTHSHFDHCGAAPYLLRAIPGARIGCSPHAADVLQKEKAIALIKQFNAEYEERMKDELQGQDTSFTALPISLRLTEGDTIQLAGAELAILETPGHTKDCLSYFWKEKGILFAGEAAGVYTDGEFHSVFLSDYSSYTASIRKIMTIGADVLCVAHSGVLEGSKNVGDYLQEVLNAAESYRGKLEKSLAKHSDDVDKVVEEITREEYDTQAEPVINRNPFMTNLRAKTQAVMRLRDQ
jgi:glyoxylase-like metal-dependent hydrolase (beta-lactamase superfamily II)